MLLLLSLDDRSAAGDAGSRGRDLEHSSSSRNRNNAGVLFRRTGDGVFC